MMQKKFMAVAAAALAAVGVFSGATPASAKILQDSGNGGCVSGLTQYGSYPQLKIYDDVTFKSATSFHIDASNAAGSVYDCGPAGHQVSGGNYKLVNAWSVSGVKLTTCTISVTDAGCSLGGGTMAKANYSKSGKNTGSTVSYKGGGWNVYASTSGSVETFSHTATYRLTYGDNAADAGTANSYRR